MKTLRNSFLVILAMLLVLPLSQLTFAQDGPQEVSLWYHSGQGGERDALNIAIESFNSSQDEYEIVPTEVPEGNYNEQVRNAALSGTLPCVLDFDGPFIYSYVESGDLTPIGEYFDEDFLADVLPSIIDQGTVDGTLWSLGQFDSGLAIWGNRALLDEAGVRIPEGLDDVWTLDEFNAAIEALDGVVPDDGYVIALQMQNEGEWFSYAFGPILRSFGADTIDRETYETAEGVLNGEAAFNAMSWLQGLFENGYASDDAVDPDADFLEGRVALAYVGHWRYVDYKAALGDDLVLIPVPDYGNGAVTGMGSWNWGITSSCESKDGAAAFIAHVMSPENVITVTDANGAVPALISVLEADERYQEGGDLWIYRQQLENGVAVPRAQTAVYPTISTAMETLVRAVARGDDVLDALDDAASAVDEAIASME
jgi:multiple sugar transport system substrate-binding protein